MTDRPTLSHEDVLLMPERDLIPGGLEAFYHAHGVVVEKLGRGYSLLSQRARAPVAWLRTTNDPDKTQVLSWTGVRWKVPGLFGRLTAPVDHAVDYIASEPAFRIHV